MNIGYFLLPDELHGHEYIFHPALWLCWSVLNSYSTSLSLCQGIDYGAIIFGVGSNRMQLPIPSSCPGGLKMLLDMCWYVCKCVWSLVGVAVSGCGVVICGRVCA